MPSESLFQTRDWANNRQAASREAMRVVIQRVSEASVHVNGECTGRIGLGLIALLGIATDDSQRDADYLSEKIIGLRLFPDEAGKFAYSVQDVHGSILVVSQFTLYGDCRKGRRPSFTAAAGVDKALPLYDYFVERLSQKEVPVATGRFQATMVVHLVNDGPVTLIIDSSKGGD
jgi:D-aminoacyl-tRNA deacylase